MSTLDPAPLHPPILILTHFPVQPQDLQTLPCDTIGCLISHTDELQPPCYKYLVKEGLIEVVGQRDTVVVDEIEDMPLKMPTLADEKIVPLLPRMAVDPAVVEVEVEEEKPPSILSLETTDSASVDSDVQLKVNIVLEDSSEKDDQASVDESKLMGSVMQLMSSTFTSTEKLFGGFERLESLPFLMLQEETESAQPVSAHPCGAEIDSYCSPLVGVSTDLVKKCLMNNIDNVSPPCHCFLSQLEMRSSENVVPLESFRAAPLTFREDDSEAPIIFDIAPPPPEHMHHGLCMLFFPLSFLVLTFVTVRLISACCVSRTRFAAVVPPDSEDPKTAPLVVTVVKPDVTAPIVLPTARI